MSLNPPPTRRSLLKPLEIVGGSAVAAIFVGIIALAGSRDIRFAFIATGAVFIIALLVAALISMGIKPDESEQNEVRGFSSSQQSPAATIATGTTSVVDSPNPAGANTEPAVSKPAQNE